VHVHCRAPVVGLGAEAFYLNRYKILTVHGRKFPDHANIIDCFQYVLHVFLMLILFTDIFIVTLLMIAL